VRTKKSKASRVQPRKLAVIACQRSLRVTTFWAANSGFGMRVLKHT